MEELKDYQYYKHMGMCPRCRKESSPPERMLCHACAEIVREYRSKWYYKNQAEIKAGKKKAYKINREQRRAYAKVYYRKNKERIAEKMRERYQKKKEGRK